jgi:DNA-binding transcriptional regulator YdaS (Cro superfamily)
MSTKTFSELLIAHGKTASSVAKALGINKATVSRWKDVPPDRVIAVEKATGIPRQELRPDLAKIFAEPASDHRKESAA